ncbi:NAD(P)/FAD-dependent oxidoreductase [Streptomyces sp. NPDC021224]|uniref:NAD(P)/FAD-dependent oxidoreductase n=1 Tax=unclassified Streptomyces TaxID=2593676 RepID=UPI003790BA1E
MVAAGLTPAPGAGEHRGGWGGAMRRIVVVGASIAGLTAAESLRAEGFDGSLVLLGEEAHRPYSRVPLSKELHLGGALRDAVLLPEPGDGIELRTGSRAVGLDTARRVVALAGGEEVPYDGLVVATGARARRLGDEDLVLRTLDDAQKLTGRLAGARGVVVVGAGFLGMELASACRAIGLDVTVVDREPPLARFLGDWLAGFTVAAARDRGVVFRLAPEGAVPLGPHALRLGGEVLEADVVVTAVGDLPNTDWLAGSGLPLDGGLVVDGRCRVAPGIVAAGDVAALRTPDGRTRRTPHWTNAVDQGRAAAATLLHGDAAPVRRPAPYFWTEQFGLDVKISGELPPAGPPEVLAGSPGDRSALLRWRHPRGATAVAVNHRMPVPRLHLLGAHAESGSG